MTRACFCPEATMTPATTTAMAVPRSADWLANEEVGRRRGLRLEAGGELGDGLEPPGGVGAVRLEEVGRLGPEPGGAAVAHRRVDVGGELLAALQGGHEALAGQVGARRLEHGADELGQAPLGQPDVVGRGGAPVGLLVRRLVGGIGGVGYGAAGGGRE